MSTNDSEWDAWRSSWTGASGKLPDLGAHAKRHAARDRWGLAVLFALMGFGIAADAWGAIHGNDPIMAVSLIGWSLVMCGGLLWTRRESRLAAVAGPRDALAFLERRVRAERWGARLVQWTYPPMFLYVAVYYRHLFPPDPIAPIVVARAFIVVMIAASLSAPWWIRRFTKRQQAEIAGWKRWLEEQHL